MYEQKRYSKEITICVHFIIKKLYVITVFFCLLPLMCEGRESKLITISLKESTLYSLQLHSIDLAVIHGFYSLLCRLMHL